MDTYHIFLDIDGVLNGIDTIKNEHMRLDHTKYICPLKLDILHDFINEMKDMNVSVKFIGISSWFITKDIETVSSFLNIDIIDKIDHCGGGSGRGKSVLNYILEHKLEKYAVLDDAGDNMYSFKTIKVCGMIGITKENINELINNYYTSEYNEEKLLSYLQGYNHAFQRVS